MADAENELKRTIDIRSGKPFDVVSHRQTRAKQHGRTPVMTLQAFALLCLLSLLLTTSAISLYAFHMASVQGSEMTRMIEEMKHKVQEVDAGVSFDSKRQRLLLGIRDEIMKANPRVGLGEAYEYASLIMNASEKYPTVDPLMFLAIGIVESGYDRIATSRANAKGLYQIWPSTGRMLARMQDWEYTDQMLYDPEKNTEMAALYLDILFSAYHDEELVLAEYNGGPLNAGYLRAGSSKAASETRDYVDKVMDVHRRLESKFERGLDVRLETMHRDRNRNGKRLGESPPSPHSRHPDTANSGQ